MLLIVDAGGKRLIGLLGPALEFLISWGEMLQVIPQMIAARSQRLRKVRYGDVGMCGYCF